VLCIAARLPACLPACPPTCLFASTGCLPACLPALSSPLPGVVGILGSTYNGEFEDIQGLNDMLGEAAAAATQHSHQHTMCARSLTFSVTCSACSSNQ
jgi:hypothetical protein